MLLSVVETPKLLKVKEIDFQEWKSHMKNCHRVNMLQCWEYGAVKEQAENWRAVHFLIADETGKPVALAQFMTKGLPIIGGIARMNRGPLLIGDINEELCEEIQLNVIRALVLESKRRRWWVIQIAPEVYTSNSAIERLKKFGLTHLPVAPWASGSISLLPDEEELLMSLKGKWRNCLRKGLRLEASISSSDGKSEKLETLLKHYQKLQADKGFTGLSDALILGLANEANDDWKFTLFIANEPESTDIKESIGMLVSVRHGDTATYLIGSTDEKGRKLQVNYLLLWEAILLAKKEGCRWFDIGGLNETTPKGIAHFKQGVNATPYTLVGEWRGFIFPWKSV